MKNEKLKALLPEIKKNVSLKFHTTFRIGGRAEYFYLAKTKEDLIKAIETAIKLNLPFFILGEGSNLLVADRGYQGLVIKIQNSKFKIQNYNSKFKIFCEAGMPLRKLVSKSLRIGATGLEWAAGIPGTVGGAIYGNAGAFGGSMADILESVEVLEIRKKETQNSKLKSQNCPLFTHSNLKIKTFKNKDCQFGYRESIFKKNSNLIILSCQLQLKKGDKQKIKERIKEYINYRREHHPSLPSAGCVFKNVSLEKLGSKFFEKFPETKNIIKENILPTAYLIDQCGLKGKRMGSAQISEIHPNFIVNLGRAKAKDVKNLINLIKKKIKTKFGIELEKEIQYLGS